MSLGMHHKAFVESLSRGHRLRREEARGLAREILKGSFPPSVIASILVLMNTRPFTCQEVLGFRDEFIEAALPLDFSEFDPVDVCGTGGDGKSTFNISTASAFLLAASGIPVAKHGNYAVSSLFGSSTIVEAMGYRFKTDPDALKRELEKTNICFLHAPLFHPAMKVVAPVRKELGVKTIFNILGPLLNPAQVRFQMSGVYGMDVFDVYVDTLSSLSESFTVAYSVDGHDEVSLTSACYLNMNGVSYFLEPGVFPFQGVNFPNISPEVIKATDTIEEAVVLMFQFLKGEADPLLEKVILTNAAFAYCTRERNVALPDAMDRLKETLKSGAAYANTVQLMEMQG
jgi:anthranilate phosphoribosyltransferase